MKFIGALSLLVAIISASTQKSINNLEESQLIQIQGENESKIQSQELAQMSNELVDLQKTPEWHELAMKLSNVTNATLSQFKAKDEHGNALICLKVFQRHDQKGPDHPIYGVYHQEINGTFWLSIAQTHDLKTWKFHNFLDRNASQGTIQPLDDGSFLLAYESNNASGCLIRMRHYKTMNHLLQGIYFDQFDIARTLAPSAEGTPSFEFVNVNKGDIHNSTIRMRFHFFKGAEADEQAMGELINFQQWNPVHTKSMQDVNDKFRIQLKQQGNLGSRESFMWRGKKYYLIEAQLINKSWESWRVFLCDQNGLPLQMLDMKTPAGSKSFANPHISQVGDEYVVSMMLPLEGNPKEENSGELVYVVKG